jgi:hypothetical protein
MDYVIVTDTTALAGPGYAFREVGALARGTVVRTIQPSIALRAYQTPGGTIRRASPFGPNCTTTALQVLRQGGVVVPAWSVSPGLLHMGVRSGPEITFMAGTIGSTTPDLMPRTSIGGR